MPPIRTHRLVFERPKGTGTFVPSDILRATLAVFDLGDMDDAGCNKLAESQLHAAEKARLSGFRHDRRRKSFISGRLAAKAALTAHLPGIDPQSIEIGSGVFDQPMIVGGGEDVQGMAVSLSHSDRFAVALVFHRAHPLGIDVDLPVMKDVPAILDGIAPDIRTMIRAHDLDDHGAACLLWVARESLAKTITTGMMTPLELYAPSSIVHEGACFEVRYANFGQYRTIIWPGAQGWLGLTLPDQTRFDPASLPWA
ncbi:hypothetical protein [Thalassospira sp. A3_1]|uniref:4'-phosphopantetheinyl transferase family protein n=1 Tax=Thalassospira sp. A3_1 TaxID=2821088 RepID=UPI001AD9B770|nr:hypothetical protein [Thalassospira sp. A3_1]MBO9509218.1 hypothetical protein [Thalassospira sp. A3_1]